MGMAFSPIYVLECTGGLQRRARICIRFAWCRLPARVRTITLSRAGKAAVRRSAQFPATRTAGANNRRSGAGIAAPANPLPSPGV